VVGVSSDEEARKGMQSCEQRIAGGDTVSTCGFREGKEAADPIGSDVGIFDLWMRRTHPDLRWCWHADDALMHEGAQLPRRPASSV
jgi:hypothetical protein